MKDKTARLEVSPDLKEQVKKAAQIRNEDIFETVEYLLECGLKVFSMQYETQHINKYVLDTSGIDDID